MITSAVKHPKNVLLIGLALALVTLALYWPVRQHAFINYDDDLYTTQNEMVQKGLTIEGVGWAFTTDQAYNWHPLTWLSHMLDYQLFGSDAGAHHLMNVAGHAANAVLLFLLLLCLTGAAWRSAAVAALFAVHPLRVESVAWIAERKDVLCLFCWLLSICAYVHYVKQPDRRRYLLLLLIGAVAMLSKPMIVTLPFTLLLLDVWPLGRLPVTPAAGGLSVGSLREAWRYLWPAARSLLREKIPLFIFAAGLSGITFWIQKESGAISVGQHHAFGTRCANAVVSYLRYLGKFLWPADLVLPYPHPGSWPLATTLAGVVLLVALSVIFVKLAARHPYFLVGWLWYLGTLVPVIGLVQVGSQAMADRYTYVPMIGILVMVVWGAADLLQAVPRHRLILSTTGALALAGCVAMTARQIRYWRNSETLFGHAIQVMPDNAIAHFNLGLALATQKKWAAAIEHYSAGLLLSPNDPKGHLNLGLALVMRQDLAGAITEFSTVLKLDPNSSQAHNNLGNALYLQGRTKEALEHYARALRLKPSNAETIINLAVALAAAGQRRDAISAFTRARQFRPNDAAIHYHLAILLAEAGDAQEALGHYREAVRLKPDEPDPLRQFAWLRATHPEAQVRDGAEAVKLAERACELTRRQSVTPLDTLAAAYAETGRFNEAATTARQALALAKAGGNDLLAARIQQRIELYQASQPFREKP